VIWQLKGWASETEAMKTATRPSHEGENMVEEELIKKSVERM
jgi:hypothetical protein